MLSLSFGCQSDRASDGGDASGDTSGGESGDGDGEVCSEWDDDAVGDAVELRLRNDRDRPIFIVGNLPCVIAYLEVHHGENYWPPHDCDPSCEALRQDGCACAEGCAQVPTVRLDPGATYVAPWPSLMRVPDELPIACGTETCPGGACSMAHRAEDGTYDLVAFIADTIAACDPDQGGDPVQCQCMPGTDGFCDLFVQPEPADILGIGTAFAVPTAGFVELVVN